MGDDGLSFDKGLDKLEALVQKLEGGGLGLEDALKCYEDGVKLSESLQLQLTEAQRRVEVLRQGLGGEYSAEPLEGDEE
ncbi:MAG: exodeoxyribonuclease VII small subunit [Holophagales bacterium]|jgi:exodeoxyribonuclease VII small subunit|nr:exodeoxyribonuclease VII small subunit [Holophagales bacterium]